jgi:short-subunit dehydrogenase involved in D-alanine esterification of teichoic acids
MLKDYSYLQFLISFYFLNLFYIATGNENVEFMELDTASIKSVQNFVEEFKKRNLPLHTLINNAGMWREDKEDEGRE